MYYYRLKPNAVPFFRNNLKTAVLDWDTWTKTYNVDHEAIERVEPCYLTYGHESTRNGVRSNSLGGWDDDGSHFHFTLNFPSMTMREHDEFTKGNTMRALMDDIQNTVNNFYSKFAGEAKNEKDNV